MSNECTINVGSVAMVSIDSISVGERARKEMGNLNDMELSLKESGLITPLAVKLNADGSYQLLAGERRFRILQKNQVPVVPVRVYEDELSEFEMLVIEKSENFFRKDFEYWEYDKLVADIHRLQQAEYGVKAPGPGHAGWTVEDTGNMVGVTKGHASVAIKRNEAREAFPELFVNCKTQQDATKLLKKLDEAAVKHVMAAKIESSPTTSRLSQLSKMYIVKDFFAGVKEIPDSIIHLVEIDPPYAIDLHGQKKSDGESCYVAEDYNEMPAEYYPELMSKVFKECYRVMADHSWLICWFAPEPHFETIYKSLIAAGFATTRMVGIWTKPSGQSMRPEIHLANSYEMFFYAWKGRPAMNKMGRRNIFDNPPVPVNQKTHPTERPVELMKDIYETFAFPGSRVLIPFLGSGNGLIAAHSLGMSPIGFDLSKGYRDSFLVKVHSMK